MSSDSAWDLRGLDRVVIDRFEFRGFHGCRSWCVLEILPRPDGRVVVIATEPKENPGTSVTNVAEHLASFVCDTFGIDPDRLVWVEHYAYPSAVKPREPRDYDRVTFKRLPPRKMIWSAEALEAKPDGWPGYFEEPEWRVMTDDDWKAVGVAPRPSRNG